MAHSASATARPPSERSCAEASGPSRRASTSSSIRRFSAVEVDFGARPLVAAADRAKKLATAELVAGRARGGRRGRPFARKGSRTGGRRPRGAPPCRRSGSAGSRGRRSRCRRRRCPETTGISSARQASAIPRTAASNCAMTSGFSGLPKLRQSVIASGRAPDAGDRARRLGDGDRAAAVRIRGAEERD